MKDFTLLFDYITGEIWQIPNDNVTETVKDIRNNYQDRIDIVVGRDNFFDVNVWFIKTINDENVTRCLLEANVADYLGTM